MGLRDGLVRLAGFEVQERAFPPGWLANQLEVMRYAGSTYLPTTTWSPDESPLLSGERAALTSNGVVYGIFRTRADLFAQGRFVWKRYGTSSRPMAADVFSDGGLAVLDNPAGVLERCELDVACTGASYWVLDGGELRNLPAEYCTIVSGSDRYPADPALAWDARKVGLIYQPPGGEPEVWPWDEVGAYVPEADPSARWRGMSWLRPAMEDVAGDNGARRFLTRFFENSATPNSVVVFPPDVMRETVEAFRDVFVQKHQGLEQSFRTAFLGGGADLKVIGSSIKDLDTESVRTQVHKDIAASAGVPVVAAGIEQGTYANSKEANRALADRKVRYLWSRAVDAFRPLVAAPANGELWIDVSGVSALQADALDDASVMAQQAQTMRTLVDGGFVPSTVITAVTTGDMSKLVHSGLLSVQTQAPGTGGPQNG